MFIRFNLTFPLIVSGFCTPGIIVAIYSIFANNSTTEYLEEHLDGNLCRCTGYRPIWDAARSLCVDAEERLVRGPCGTPCRECPERRECEMDCNTSDKAAEEEEKKYDDPGMCCSSSLDKAKETVLEGSWLDQPNIMFPKSLLGDDPNFEAELAKPLIVVDRSEFHASGTWVKPTTLVDLLNLISEFGSGGCKIVVGNTEVGIGMWLFSLLHFFIVYLTKCLFPYRNKVQACGLPSFDLSVGFHWQPLLVQCGFVATRHWLLHTSGYDSTQL